MTKIGQESQCALCVKEGTTCIPCRADRLIQDIRHAAFEKWGSEQNQSEWEERCLKAEAKMREFENQLYCGLKPPAFHEHLARIAELEAAFDKYGKHFALCKVHTSMDESGNHHALCDCGYDTALEALSAKEPK